MKTTHNLSIFSRLGDRKKMSKASCESSSSENGKGAILYQVRVSDSSTQKEWDIYFRFSEMYAFASELKNLTREKIPPFPSKYVTFGRQEKITT